MATGSDYEKILMCLTAWREARGEGPNGMLAVLWIIKNRSVAWRKAVSEIITDVNQFSSISLKNDPEAVLWPHPSDPQFQFCMQNVDSIYDGTGQDTLTHDSLFYYNPATANSPWFVKNIVDSPDHPMTVKIGNQIFYK